MKKLLTLFLILLALDSFAATKVNYPNMDDSKTQQNFDEVGNKLQEHAVATTGQHGVTGTIVGTGTSPTFTDLTVTYGVSAGSMTATTVSTGQGAYELYKMDQNVDTAASPTFAGATIGSLAGVVKATAGVLSALTVGNSLEISGTNLNVANAITDRGDPSPNDFDITSFTTDGTWRDLDLSAIVPAGAKVVWLVVSIKDDAVGSLLRIRKNGNSNGTNVGGIICQVANQAIEGDLWCAIDANRVIEYVTTNTTFTSIYLNVRGWSY